MDTPDLTSRGISQAVSNALKDAGISQREAADRSGIPITTLSRRLTGNSPFLVTELAVLAAMVGTSVSELIATAETSAA
jgi:transcriptional regulator with XRE-family HTH domain